MVEAKVPTEADVSVEAQDLVEECVRWKSMVAEEKDGHGFHGVPSPLGPAERLGMVGVHPLSFLSGREGIEVGDGWRRWLAVRQLEVGLHFREFGFLTLLQCFFKLF